MRAPRVVTHSRRRFLKTVPAAVAGAITTTAWAQQPAGSAGTVTADTIRAAEALDDLKFSRDEETAAVRAVSNELSAYQRLRDMKITQEVDPAYVFKPLLPNANVAGPATPGRAIRYNRPRFAPKRPANLEDVAFWPVTSLAMLLESRIVSSVELTRMYLQRLKRYQPKLNFYVTLTEELALKQAAEADRAIAAGKYKGPLHGIPWGAKDLFATKGIKTTWGGEPYVDQVIDHDATVVERLHNAGAVLIAKLSLGALAQGDRWFGGQTMNPWDATQGSSGSSAGPASAAAAGCVAFAIGTETRGSIISPAGVTGCVGLRPTYGRVSRYGAMALSTTMDKVGPLCRYVEDSVLVLNAIYGPDGRDTSVADAAFRWNDTSSTLVGNVDRAMWPLSNFKIAYFKTAFDEPGARGGGGGRGAGAAGAAGARGGTGVPASGAARIGRGGPPLTPEQQAANLRLQQDARDVYLAVIEVFAKLGVKPDPIEPLPELAQISGALNMILSVESSASFDADTRSGDINALSTGTSRSSWPNTFREARFVPAVEYIQAMRARTILQQRMNTFMQYDAILSPGDTLSSVANLTGHPAISVKCGMVGGHPRPLVLTGRLYDEVTLCRIALAFEQATEWKDRHPSMAGLA